ncbi:MAG: TonB-dependent receptor [Hymenobacter sp.]|nr:MAG: TonB-dependent receptor [Hymenobacter sp.]
MRKLLFPLSAMVVVLGAQDIHAQTRTTSGRVVGSDGAGLPGVTVLVKGTTLGTATDMDGRYTLAAPATATTLVFSFVGYTSQEARIGDGPINVTLASNPTSLDEAIVVGYGTQERRDLTGSVATVKGDAIANLATPSFAQQLGGRAAGVNVQTPTALLGQTPRIQIRGVNSLTSGTYPLVVVDGQPIFTGSNSLIDGNASSGLADINPNDIESFEVLKDGSATAIYGTRGANGVILITTKKGRKGKATLTYDTYIGAASTLKRYSVLNANDFVTISNEKQRAAAPTATTPLARDYLDANGNPVSTDWQDQIFRVGFQQSHALSVSGATDKTNYFFSAGYTNQKGVIRSNELQRFNLRGNVNADINDWLRVGFNTALSRTQTLGLNVNPNALSGNVVSALALFPNVPVRNEDGTPFVDPASGTIGQGNNSVPISSNYPNIVNALENNISRSVSYRILGSGFLEVEPVKNLLIRSQLSTDTQLEDDFQYYDPRYGDGRNQNGYVYQGFAPSLRWNWQNTASYNTIIANDHKVNAVLGVEYQSTETRYYAASGNNLSDRLLALNGINSGSLLSQNISGDYYGKNGFQSYFGRLNYSFKDRYLLSATLRSDAISSLAPGKQRGWFPGGSLGWRVSEESFFKNLPVATVWTDFKLRGSYARVGNSSLTSNFPYAGSYSAAQYASQSGIAYNQFGNSELQWETSKKEDYGVDLGFFGGRIIFTADYYRNFNDGLILSVPTPPSLGVPNNSYNANVGSIWNKGLELSLTTQNVRNDKFTWTTSANFSTNVNQVTQLANGVPFLLGNYNGNAYTITQVGSSASTLWGYDYQGVNPANGNPIYRVNRNADGTSSLIQGNIATQSYLTYDPTAPGAASTAAAPLSSSDKILLGQTNPKFYGGFDNTFTFAGFDLNVFLRYNFGNSIMNVTRQNTLLNQNFTNNGSEILGRWQSVDNPGDGTTPRVYQGRGGFINQEGNTLSRFVEKGDFVRVQNITLGYTVPARFTNALHLNRLRIYGQVQNLYTFTKYKGVDPEVNLNYGSGVNGNLVSGLDYASNPQQRVFTGGINVSF